jgi:hypothetical protein
MIKALDGTCVGGVVKVGTLVVEDAIILSEGVAESEGTVFIDGEKIYYVAKTTPDVKTALTKLVTVLGHIATALQTIDSNGYLIAADAGVPGPPINATNIANLNTVKTEIQTLKDALK